MADDQEAASEEENVPDYGTDDILETTTQPPAIVDEVQLTTTATLDDFADDEEDLPDVTVNLFINDDGTGDVTVPSDIVQLGLTDIYGNPITSTSWVDTVHDYTAAITQGVSDELNGNGTSIGGKGWFGPWTWNKILFVGLIALCIIGIILAILFIVIGKKFQKNKRTTTTGSTTTTKNVVTTNIAAGGKYEPVRNV
ncbi:hypothetical protein I4U23_005961 [Adineta vaga]|nr:hypothetical protein I4U23_005961 [Adineta vaga]